MSTRPSGRGGRPPVTDHSAIERAAFDLFDERGFEATTVEDIARAAGIGRRTLFRYFPSKNDIPWGRFDDSLRHLRAYLDATPAELPVHVAVHRAVLDFNHLEQDAVAQHRRRMRLLLTTPALQAHSALRYEEWRGVIADFVARRFELPANHLLPRTAGRVSLALALSAYEQWLDDEDAALGQLLDDALKGLRDYLLGPAHR